MGAPVGVEQTEQVQRNKRNFVFFYGVLTGCKNRKLYQLSCRQETASVSQQDLPEKHLFFVIPIGCIPTLEHLDSLTLIGIYLLRLALRFRYDIQSRRLIPRSLRKGGSYSA